MNIDKYDVIVDAGSVIIDGTKKALEYVDSFIVTNALFWGVLFLICIILPFYYGLISTYSNISSAKNESFKNLASFLILPNAYLFTGLIIFIFFTKILNFQAVDPGTSINNFFEMSLATHGQQLEEQGLGFLKGVLVAVEALSAVIIYISALTPAFLFFFFFLLSFVLKEKIEKITMSKITFWIMQIFVVCLFTTIMSVFFAFAINKTILNKPIATKWGELKNYNQMQESLTNYYIRRGLGAKK
jgi:lysylphosphatidylglycerol synthetase-like protein (DUF2156 family)